MITAVIELYKQVLANNQKFKIPVRASLVSVKQFLQAAGYKTKQTHTSPRKYKTKVFPY